MTGTVHKIILTNNARLQAKYGAAYASIQTAIRKWISTDLARGLTSVLVPLDDAGTMASLGGVAVTVHTDEAQNKQAVDAVFNHYQPDYLVILGAPDVIPHQSLANPAYSGLNGDPDQTVPSDLPYAGPSSGSTNIRDYINATRVIGRVPDVTGATQPTALIKAIATASGWTQRSASVYRRFLGISAQVWQRSTQASVTAAFGTASGLQSVPPRTYAWAPTLLDRPAHFINCHGSPASPDFYGQPASGARTYPEAHKAAYIQGKIRKGTVAAAECCYGAELYDPTLAAGQMGIANQYMAEQAYAFFGSTTIAYGPASGNNWADDLCRDFFVSLLSGASTGRSVLQALQAYIAARSQLSAVDLKTLAQFTLLGDPASTPVKAPPSHTAPDVLQMKGPGYRAASQGSGEELARSQRRVLLSQNGQALAQSAAPVMGSIEAPEAIAKLVRSRIKSEFGVSGAVIHGFQFHTPPLVKSGLPSGPQVPSLRVPKASFLGFARQKGTDNHRVPRFVGVEVVEYESEVVVKPFHSH